MKYVKVAHYANTKFTTDENIINELPEEGDESGAVDRDVKQVGGDEHRDGDVKVKTEENATVNMKDL